MRPLHLLLPMLLFAAACDRAAPRSEHTDDLAAPVAAPSPPMAAPGGFAALQAADASATDERAQIREGRMRIRVASVDSAAARATALAAGFGGHTARSDLRYGEGRTRGGAIELRIPAPRFDEALNALAALGRLEHSSVTSTEIGDQIVDHRSRLQNARQLEARLLELLRTRTGSLQDVLAAERELARVREEIERIDARLTWLRNRVAMSVIALDVYESAPVVALTPAGKIMGDSFRAAWQNFVAFIAGLIAALGYLIPLAAIAAAAALLARRWLRREPPHTPAPPAGGEAPAGGILGA